MSDIEDTLNATKEILYQLSSIINNPMYKYLILLGAVILLVAFLLILLRYDNKNLSLHYLV